MPNVVRLRRPEPERQAAAPLGRTPTADVAAQRSYRLLHFIFAMLPIITGIDKFTQLLTNWDQYLAPWVARLLPFSPNVFMRLSGIGEILVGVLVGFRPRFAFLISLWLFGIIINLLTSGRYFDIALRDFGLALSALALSVLSSRLETK